MADSVQRTLEDMLPELDDLQALGIFTPNEIRTIVSRRREFEYRLKRRVPKRVDYMRYIAFELKLETLRRSSKERLGLRSTSLSDFTFRKRLHFIYNRATRRFPGDVALWEQYIDFAMRAQSGVKLSRVLTRALQLHPLQPKLWLRAAAYEFDHANNSNAARVLLQRALRLNKQSKQLWLAFFRMELLFIRKVRTRAELLGIDEHGKLRIGDVTPSDSSGGGEETEGDADAAAELARAGQRRASLLNGAVARIVLHRAVAALPGDIPFIASFLRIAEQFPRCPGAADAVYDVLASEELQHNAHARALLASRPLRSARLSLRSKMAAPDAAAAALAAAEAEAIARFDAAAQQLATEDMWDAYADFLADICCRRAADNSGSSSSGGSDSGSGEDATTTLLAQAVQTQLAVYDRAWRAEAASPRLLLRWLALLLHVGRLEEAVDVAAQATDAQPQSARLWLMRADILRRHAVLQGSGDAADGSEALLQTALESVSPEQAAPLWLQLMDSMLARDAPLPELMRVVHDASRQPLLPPSCTARLRSALLDVATLAGDAARAAVQKKLLAVPLPTTAATEALLLRMVAVEAAQPRVDMPLVRRILARGYAQFGKRSLQLWWTGMQLERQHGTLAASQRLYWRGMKTLAQPSALVRKAASLEGV